MHTIFVLQIIFLPFSPFLLGDSLTMFVILESDESVQLFCTKSSPYWKLKFIPVFAKALSHSERVITQKRDLLQARKYFLQVWKFSRKSELVFKIWKVKKNNISFYFQSNFNKTICTGCISSFNNTFVWEEIVLFACL